MSVFGGRTALLGAVRFVNCLYFLKVFKTKLAALAAISGLLVAAKWTSVAQVCY